MRHIYRSTRLPRRGYLIDGMAWVFACPAAPCEYEFAYDTREAAVTGAVLHCRAAGGEAHDQVIVDLCVDASPLFIPEIRAAG